MLERCTTRSAKYLSPALFLPKRMTMPTGPIVLVDTFIYADSFVSGKFRDHHYPGMTDYLDAAERAQVFFAPSYYRIRNYTRFFWTLRAMRDNMILKEDVLNASDYLFALGHPFRLRWPKGRIDFLGMDVGPLIRETLLESFAGSGAIEGLLRYRFAQRLKERGISPQRIVEWFENQEIDHGANAGWRTFFPDTPVIGYQGFLASRHYLCVFPTTREDISAFGPEPGSRHGKRAGRVGPGVLPQTHSGYRAVVSLRSRLARAN